VENGKDPFVAWADFHRTIQVPLEGLRRLTELRQTLDRVERELVVSARRHSWSWQEIGDALGLSRQAAHARHRPFVKRAAGDSPRFLP
jgi:DNA-directed RNA polymerase specialized sigma24 family protein